MNRSKTSPSRMAVVPVGVSYLLGQQQVIDNFTTLEGVALLTAPSGQDELGVGLFDGELEEAAFEHLATAFDARFEALGKISVLRG
jgi:hypothetical protein